MAGVPIFELHIRPMFRPIDRIHMLRLGAPKRVDLWNYDEVHAKAQAIETWLTAASPMPPGKTGGPWPEEWIALFRRWRQTGCQRLDLAQGSNFQLVETDTNRFVLSCDVALPEQGAVAWFDIDSAAPDKQHYTLVLQRGDRSLPTSSSLLLEARISGPLSTASVLVRDAAGDHSLPVP